jgi:serine protease Do
MALPNISDVVALVKPSVVSITTEVTVLDFFNRQYTEEGAGSGWIIDSNGIIVTNNHVVEGAKTVTVTLDNGESYSADVKSIATDTVNDLAIVKINAKNLTALRVGDSSKLRVGDWVVAIGNSLGRGTRATVGIVSQLGVSLEVDQDQTLYNLIDTSAAINPGNSGGPLVNLSGEVVGITSAKIVATGAEATGFAISMETATPIIQSLVNKGFVSRPWIGVGLYTVDQTAIRQLKLSVNSGVVIIQMGTDSPASQAGLQKYDVIVSIGGQKVTDIPSFTLALNACKIDQPCEVKYWRGNTQNTITVTPVETPRT